MRGSIIQRSPGSWTLILDLGYEPDPTTGKLRRRQKWHTFRGTRKKAEDRLTELLNAVRTDQYVDPSKTTLGQWLTRWIDVVKPTIKRPSTFVRYNGVVQNHLLKASIAGMAMQKVRGSDIENYYAGVSGRQRLRASHGPAACAAKSGQGQAARREPRGGLGPRAPAVEGEGVGGCEGQLLVGAGGQDVSRDRQGRGRAGGGTLRRGARQRRAEGGAVRAGVVGSWTWRRASFASSGS